MLEVVSNKCRRSFIVVNESMTVWKVETAEDSVCSCCLKREFTVSSVAIPKRKLAKTPPALNNPRFWRMVFIEGGGEIAALREWSDACIRCWSGARRSFVRFILASDVFNLLAIICWFNTRDFKLAIALVPILMFICSVMGYIVPRFSISAPGRTKSSQSVACVWVAVSVTTRMTWRIILQRKRTNQCD